MCALRAELCTRRGSRPQLPGCASSVHDRCGLGSSLACGLGRPARASREGALAGVSPAGWRAGFRRRRWVSVLPLLPSGGSLLAACGWGWGALCRLPRARTSGSAPAVYAPVRAPRDSSPALGAAFAATVCSPGPPPPPLPPAGPGLCPLGPRCSPRARRTSSRRMPGPVSTAAAAGRAGTERGRKMVPGLSPSPRAALRPGPGSPPRTPTRAAPPPVHTGGRESASERGSRNGARAATSSLGNGCHSNGVALPGNTTAGWRRPLPHPSPPPTRAHSSGAQGERGAQRGHVVPLARLGVPASTAHRGWGWGQTAVGTSWLPRGCSRRSRAPGVAANVGAAQPLGLSREEEAWRLGLGSLPIDPPTIHRRHHPPGPNRAGPGHGLSRAGFPRGDVSYQGRGAKLASLLLMAGARVKPGMDGPAVPRGPG
nr:proline-rich protein 7 isoform X2 [Macaca nemestrina]